MAKPQLWYVTTIVFVLMYMTSQIFCTSQKTFLDHLYQPKQVSGSSDDRRQFNVFRRINEPSPGTKVSGVNQQMSKEKDLIKQLPGQPPVSFKQYGGYVGVNEPASRFLYYYFVEMINANDSSPLVIWFNGGPGCSSLEGAFMEHGPFRVHSDGKTLYRNPYSWNNEANVLYVESPTQVGFSYDTTTKYNMIEYGSKGDNVTAEDNYSFLVNWLERFPEYKRREFYISGQSYGGHYGPQLAQIIINRNNQNLINLQGVLIGNPGLDKNEEAKGDNEYLATHAVATQELVEEERHACDFKGNGQNEVRKCEVAKEKITNLTKDLNLYNIYAPRCLNPTLTSIPKKDASIMKYEPCSETYLTAYLNMKNVQQVMHVNTKQVSHTWNTCNDYVSNYWLADDKYLSISPILHELMDKGIRVWVYSGDADAVVSVTSTMYVLKTMNLTVENVWRPWFSQGQVGGYTQEYKNNFTFSTVREGGHAVPGDQPSRALTLFTTFIRNLSLPTS